MEQNNSEYGHFSRSAGELFSLKEWNVVECFIKFLNRLTLVRAQQFSENKLTNPKKVQID